MPSRPIMTPQMIAARDELYALFAVTPQQIKAARNPGATITALAGRRQFKRPPSGARKRKADEAS